MKSIEIDAGTGDFDDGRIWIYNSGRDHVCPVVGIEDEYPPGSLQSGAVELAENPPEQPPVRCRFAEKVS
ncbi:MAG: hypothetical protein V2I30_12140 [Erythrobacter sp.]|nr:hypothetical protein [Erythrobacter sp.]